MSLHEWLVSQKEFESQSNDWDDVIHDQARLNFPVVRKIGLLLLKDGPVNHSNNNFQCE